MKPGEQFLKNYGLAWKPSYDTNDLHTFFNLVEDLAKEDVSHVDTLKKAIAVTFIKWGLLEVVDPVVFQKKAGLVEKERQIPLRVFSEMEIRMVGTPFYKFKVSPYLDIDQMLATPSKQEKEFFDEVLKGHKVKRVFDRTAIDLELKMRIKEKVVSLVEEMNESGVAQEIQEGLINTLAVQYPEFKKAHPIISAQQKPLTKPMFHPTTLEDRISLEEFEESEYLQGEELKEKVLKYFEENKENIREYLDKEQNK